MKINSSMFIILYVSITIDFGDTREASSIILACIYYNHKNGKLLGNHEQTVGNMCVTCPIVTSRFSSVIMVLFDDLLNT